MPKPVQPRPSDVLHYGTQIATLKASMGHQKWAKFVKHAHARGFTVEGALSGQPDALKERTRSSIVKQANRTVATAYKPVYTQLDARTAAIQAIDSKQRQDEQAYQTWLAGQADRIDAAARAADATLAAQQGQIASDNTAAYQAAQADSLRRAGATPGNVSNPAQSKALDYSAAAARSADMIAGAREQSAELQHSAEQSRGLSREALLANAAAEQAKRQGETWAAMAQVGDDRGKAVLQQAADAAKAVQDLLNNETSKAQQAQQNQIAAESLNIKQRSLAQQVRDSNRKYGLAKQKAALDKWIAENHVAVDKAKIKLGYSQIKATQGKAAADRALRRWAEKQQNKRNAQDNATSEANNRRNNADSGGSHLTSADRTASRQVYTSIENARDFIFNQVSRKGKSLEQARQAAINTGFTAPQVALALAVRRSGGHATPEIVQMAKNLGIIDPRELWPPLPHGHRPGTAGNPNVGS